jgi:alpha-D-ribose 1-methylphosphonate 5-triphosphate synthase subunit PhnG
VLEGLIIEPLVAARRARQQETRARVAGTRVEFFTMVRGEE